MKRDISPLSNLQALNLALATGFIVTCGDAVQAISDKWTTGDPPVGSEHVWLLILLVSIGAKVAFDDHVALFGGKIRPFLAIDTSFLIIGYCVIISSAALIATFYLSTALLGAYILVLCVWNLVILAIDMFGRKPALALNSRMRKSAGIDRMKWWFGCLNVSKRAMDNVPSWFFLDFLFAALIIVASLAQLSPPYLVLLGFAFLFFDIVISQSFSQ